MRALILVAGAALSPAACPNTDAVTTTVVEENVAVATNAGRVTATGLVSEFNPELAKGIFHTMEGLVSWGIAMAYSRRFAAFKTDDQGPTNDHGPKDL